MPSLIDRECAHIGEMFLRIVRDSRVLEDTASIQGSHDLITGNLKVNAIAGRDLLNRPSYNYYLGLALALMDAALTLAAMPEFFPQVKLDVKSVTEFRPITQSSFASYDYLRAGTPKELKRFTPHKICLDKNRMTIANVLFDVASRFVAGHEQWHFLHGHVHYKFSKSGTSSFRELPTDGIPREVEPEIARALEFDADAATLVTVLTDILAFPAMFDAGKIGIKGLDGAKGYVHIFMVGVSCLFAILARSDRYYSPGKSTHPTAAARMFNIWVTFLKIYERKFGKIAPDHPLLRRTIADVNVVLDVLQGPQIDADAIIAWANGAYIYDKDGIVKECLTAQHTLRTLKPYLKQFEEALMHEVLQSKMKDKTQQTDENSHGA